MEEEKKQKASENPAFIFPSFPADPSPKKIRTRVYFPNKLA